MFIIAFKIEGGGYILTIFGVYVRGECLMLQLGFVKLVSVMIILFFYGFIYYDFI